MPEKRATVKGEEEPLLNNCNSDSTRGNGTAIPPGDSPLRDNQVIVRETFEGYVLQVIEEGVYVQYDTGDDLVEQFYRTDQFQPGKVPASGDRIVVDVVVRALATPEDSTTTGKFDEHSRKNVVSGNLRF